MSSKDVEEALRKNRNLQNILNQQLHNSTNNEKIKIEFGKSSKPKTIFKMLNKSIYVKDDVDDATVGISLRPPLKQALDFGRCIKKSINIQIYLMSV